LAHGRSLSPILKPRRVRPLRDEQGRVVWRRQWLAQTKLYQRESHTVIDVAFELDHVGAVVSVAVTNKQWSADATLFAVSANGVRIEVPHASMGAAGPSLGIAAITKRYQGAPLPEETDARQRVLDAYRVQRYDVEDAMNGMLGRDPEMHRPPRLSWNHLIELLAEHGTVVSEEQLIAMPFRFEFSAQALAALEQK
jgi:hypothetical protein